MRIQALTAWHQTLATIMTLGYSDKAITELIKGLERLVNGCSSEVIIYTKGQPPKMTHHRVLASGDPLVQVDGYISGGYLLDPYYRKAIDEQAQGIFALKDVAFPGFKESEYYNIYFDQAGVRDEACFLFQLENKSVASISIARMVTDDDFTREDIQLLESTFPLVKLIIARWLESASKRSQPTIEWLLDNALARFGTSVLTPKERDILELLLRGHSVKLIAQKLSNSLGTIKHHRKNIYTKLDVCSQAELFYLFISALREAPNDSTADPLISFSGPLSARN